METGIDIIEIERFMRADSPRFAERCFTADERAYIAQKGPQTAAGMFAAKEAVAKALGTGFRGFWPNEIEIIHDALGRPSASFHGRAAGLINGRNVNLSISHNKTTAAAVALIENGDMTSVFDGREPPFPLPPRVEDSHKYTFGRVCALAGSYNMPGAALLCCAAAYRAGAGLVDACVLESVAGVIHARLPEAVTTILPGRRAQYGRDGDVDAALNAARRADVLILGPGIGGGDSVKAFVNDVLTGLRADGAGNSALRAVVLDADGLNAVADNPSVLKKINIPCVITPHTGEMSRLTRKPPEEIAGNRPAAAAAFAGEFGVVTLCKGRHTAVASPAGDLYINATGNAALAKAGTGDALTGVIAGLIAQGKPPYEAAALGAYLHGMAGEAASESLGLYGVNAADVIDALARVMMRYTE